MPSIFLKNYTSDVPSSATVFYIEKALIRCGVSGISKQYRGTDGEIEAILFTVKSPDGRPICIRIPADKDACLNALWMDYVDGDKLNANGDALVWSSRKKKKKSDFAQQAERTAWKLARDWIEVQLSMIQMRQADFAQVFLPYVWNGRETFYDRIKGEGLTMLTEGSNP